MESKEPISPSLVAAHLLTSGVDLELTDLEWTLLLYDGPFWLRPNQWEPPGDWLYWGNKSGRGWGKSTGFTYHIHKNVATGHYRKIGLIAQDEERSLKLQVKPLIDSSPPWAKCEMYRDELYWPTGAIGTIYTPEAPDKIRGFNGDCAWCSEFVGWQRTTRWDAWCNLATAIREGGARVLWDSTSKGRNEIIEFLEDLNKEDPLTYPITEGAIWDNPFLGKKYLRTQYKLYPTGRRREEELEGKSFREAEGALWEWAWIDARRVDHCPQLQFKLVSLDPAITTADDSDATGLIVGGLGKDGDAYITHDRSEKVKPEGYAKRVVDEHAAGALGAIVETNRGGDAVIAVIRAVAQQRNVDVRVIETDKPFPHYSPRTLWLKKVHSRGSKSDRGGPVAACYEFGQVHHVGNFPELEYQQTTYVVGKGESPNNYDACNMLVTELLRLDSNRPTAAAQSTNTVTAAKASETLQSRLRAVSRARSIT